MEVKKKLPAVTFTVGLPSDTTLEAVYIVGNINELGNWNPEKALKVKRLKSGAYSKTIRLPLGTEFEFKVLNSCHFDNVEKGRYFEELENRYGKVVCEKNKFLVEVKSFNN